eukprot:gene1575-3047_t
MRKFHFTRFHQKLPSCTSDSGTIKPESDSQIADEDNSKQSNPTLTMSKLNPKVIGVSSNIPECIMDDTMHKMSIPLIDYSPVHYAEEILTTSRMKPRPRWKPFHAIVKVTGGGKTRALEEIRRELLLKDNVLPVAITFNAYWSVTYMLDDSYPLSVISRMASMFHDCPLAIIVDQVKKSLLTQEKLSSFRSVDTFVFLMDEVVHIDEYLDKFSPRDVNIKDKYSRKIWGYLLNNNSLMNNGSVLDIGLVVSSLEIAPLGKIDSGRIIKFINLPSNLDVARIEEDIWVPHIFRSDDDRLKLRLVAAMINSIPRFIEYAKLVVNHIESIRKANKSEENFTRSDIREIIQQIIAKVFLGFSMNLPPNNLLAAIIFGDKVSLKDDYVLKGIRRSLIMNSVCAIDFPDPVIASVQTSSFLNILDAITDFELDKVGYILEVIAFEWLKIRVKLSAVSNEGNKSLARILGINNGQIKEVIPPKYWKIMEAQMSLGKSKDIALSSPATKNMLDAMQGNWDICLKIWRGEKTKPLYIFLEFTSIEETMENSQKFMKPVPQVISLELSPKKGKQYISTILMMGNADNFIYVYMKTYNADSFGLEKLVCLNRVETLQFLGPLTPLYLEARCANPGPMQNRCKRVEKS